MNYSDAIVYLKEHNIKKDDGTFYEFGEVWCNVTLTTSYFLPHMSNTDMSSDFVCCDCTLSIKWKILCDKEFNLKI